MPIPSNKKTAADKTHLTSTAEAAVEVTVKEVKVKITTSFFLTVLAFGVVTAIVAVLRILYGA